MICYLSLGANLGCRGRQLARAISELASRPELLLLRVSPVYETVPVGYAPGPDNPNYLNLVLCLEAAWEPLELLGLAHAIEAALGRERSVPNAPRTIDIDLLACGGIMQDENGLTLPHPRLWERQFVLAPLADLAPEFRVGGRGPAREHVNPHDPEIKRLGALGDLVRRNR
ncbi:MAG: 2-amino-4-hydroxy-6-hydroxymethyldihydropteridine diphosphokinase [Armatimonadota bacterium]